ncbi:patatin-like phospholipase family protein [Rubrivivax albus]|uniref:Patatin-like phospholipase family protein n=1 Tax=Rubrivivax albus TaxID=2499835 RepID=A0A3S2URZ9_9BURK|nr:patatin-like phospholipase family protein [Rubrivivax albus]RVT53703.1 patatin-like phospholipase family protein [Rubrivivax albus]
MSSRAKSVPVDLALQGGGSHGAFTWGVLDRLLEDASLAIDGVSGTSAGALNAGVLATGWANGGRAGARAALRAFWRDVAGAPGCFGQAGSAPAWPVSLPLPLTAFNLDANPFYAWWQFMARGISPYQFNPFGPNALGEVARRHVDEAALHRGPLKLFITATAVHSGQPRVFSGEALSIDALLASACLPQLFKAVVIDGEPYWDGGYTGNPALWPLVYGTRTADLLLVKINPLWRPGTPDTAPEIADRVNEITFNAGLVAEMRAIHFVQRLLAEQRVDTGHYKALRLHMVADDEGLAPLQASSKLNTSLVFLEQLHALGRAAAERWLHAHRRDLGRRQTLDVEATFLLPRADPGRD